MTVERVELQEIPFPFTQFADLMDPLPHLELPGYIHDLLEQSQGLAHVCFQASTSPNTCTQDLSQGLYILAEYLEATLALWERWRGTTALALKDQEEGDAPHAIQHVGPVTSEEEATHDEPC